MPVTINQKALAPNCLIINGTIIDPFNRTELKKDIRIKDDKISDINSKIQPSDADYIIDASGKYITTGFFDMHVHFRDPGYEEAENIISGSNAAMAGGFTGVALMPNTTPSIDNVAIFKNIQKRAEDLLVEINQIPAITIGREGNEIVDMTEFHKNGALAFSDDGSGIGKSEVMRKALQTANKLALPLLVHSEDMTLEEGVMNDSKISRKLGLPGISSLSEDIMVARDILIAEYTNSKVHFQHVSTKGSAELIRLAKKKGLKVTAEATPHHFSLTDEMIETLSTDYKMKPPLREIEDKVAICQALKDNTIDAIATDHAPHAPKDKNVKFENAPFGALGLETAFAAGLKNLVNKNILTLAELINKMTIAPRQILNLKSDLLKIGETANLVIFDTTTEWTVDRKKLQSLSENTCFNEEKFKGKIHCVINKGMICND